MNIPRYWVQQSRMVPDAGGRECRICAWGWSSESPEDAVAVANTRLDRVAQWYMKGTFPAKYEYLSANPRREEIIRELKVDEGEPVAVITRNRYGAWVLNSPDVAFMDVDFPPPRARGVLEGLKFAFSAAARAAREEELKEQTLRDLEAWAASADGRPVRMYRTPAGVRLLFTQTRFDPTGDEIRALMNRLNCDPLYAVLTRRQACFRARLSPKPWRLGLPNPPFEFPRETPEHQDAFQTWLSRYDQASASRAACMLWKQTGPDAADPRIRAVVELHDQLAARADRLEDLA